ncbi:protein-export chaperone SecB [Moraxella nasovis]|uniref:protein-export chaperone SecB n=1 Tax=Moraxella nasovis TaxID=2904121 RepID=UPI001F615917|nr:protein-export chaperone SecB [Moraxella nasovis]UNU72964.1 protein-export chaperone SecB [Moraxella nasovis]
MAEQQSPQLGLERIYVKDISFEVPSAEVFTKEWQPQLDVSVTTTSNELDEDHKEIVLSVSVTAKNSGSTAFIAEVQQAGIFLLRNIPEADLPHLLQAYCPNVLFPYAREVISDIVNRGSFPQLLLAPVNFDQAFLQAQAELQNEESKQADA